MGEMGTTTTTPIDIASAGFALRAARERAGLTRVQLAVLADCSLTALASIEQGLVPRRSRILPRAWAALLQADPHNDHERPAQALVEKASGDGAHVQV